MTAVTRSGTNDFRGIGCSSSTATAAGTRKTYFDDPNSDIPQLTRNQFGGYLGGPIAQRPDVLLRQLRGAAAGPRPDDASRPCRAARRARGPTSARRRGRTCCSIPSRTARRPARPAIYTVQSVAPTRENYALGKVDHTLTQSQSVSVRYSWDKAQVDQDAAIPLWTIDTRTQTQSVVGEHKWIVSPTLLNVGKVAWNQRVRGDRQPREPDVRPEPVLRARHALRQHVGVGHQRPRAGYQHADVRRSEEPAGHRQPDLVARRSHNVKTGLNFTHYMNDQDSSFDFGGNYAFTSLENFVQNRPGHLRRAGAGSTTDRRWRQNLIGLYAQDDWSADAQPDAEPRRALRVHHHAERARRPRSAHAGSAGGRRHDRAGRSSRTRRSRTSRRAPASPGT